LNSGCAITTSEGLESGDDQSDDVQEAFLNRRAYQCSYCIPAMVLTIRSYLDNTDHPSVEGAREILAGNLCRCGSYPNVLEAVADLIERRSPTPYH
jgi:aerobic-type carbon monoxide dehydrogenase small subunit (CoxS/CutS family)